MRKFFIALAILFVVVSIGAVAYLWTPPAPDFDQDAARETAQTYQVEIVRDEFGVPHIIGETDADTHFGFAFAHSEDDWETLQETLIASRGQSALYFGQKDAPADYLFDLFRVEATSTSDDLDVPDDVRAIVRAYADGINFWGAENPDRVLPGVLPVTEADIHAGVIWATPFFYRLDGYLEPLFSETDKPQVSPWDQEASLNLPEAVRGSNGFAVAPSRSEDGHTRLIVNSHQPMTGRYAWYEAHLMSREGLNIFGGVFPGTPVIPQGITPNTAWTHTVNRPDLVDIYKLTVDDDKNPTQYRLDGGWRDFEREDSRFRVKLFGPFSLPIKRDVLWSEHGPVLSTPNGHFALKFAGLTDTGAVEQWFRMGKAENMSEWREALEINGVLSFNIVYGDREGNIGTIYNARMPNRDASLTPQPDWTAILPGDDSRLIFEGFRPVSDLPQIWNPECGWLFSANATPFRVTDPECNNDRADYSETFGIESRMTNRAMQAQALMIPDEQISLEELLTYRRNDDYHPDHRLMRMVREITSSDHEGYEIFDEAKAVLAAWDGSADRSSPGAALAILTGMRAYGYEFEDDLEDVSVALERTMAELEAKFGRIDPEWGEVNRIIRGDENWPLDGGPDTLRAIYFDVDGLEENGTLNAFAGDTHIMVADWAPDGTLLAQSVHQYGAATIDESSPHYDDQVELFATHQFKTLAMTEDDVRASAVETYRPGERRSPR